MSTFIAFKTLYIKELLRFLRIWQQTLLPPIITMILYLLIFGGIIGNRIGDMSGINYIDFIIPGLIIMAIITNSYSNTVSSFFFYKYSRSIDELLVATIPYWVIVLAIVMAGVTRGFIIGFLLYTFLNIFWNVEIINISYSFIVLFFSCFLFATMGLINGIFANDFDDVSSIQVFVLTPLTYLGGLFYSIEILSPFWQKLSYFNPIFFMIDSFRYSFLNISFIDIDKSIIFLIIISFIVFLLAIILVKKGVKIKY